MPASDTWIARHGDLLRVALAALAVRGFGLLLFLGASAGAPVDGYGEFLALRQGETRAERLQAIEEDLTQRLAPFDGQFYLDISRRGYRRFEEWPYGNFAFFPLYPSLLALLELTGAPDTLLAALLGVVLAAGAAVCLWMLAERLSIPSWMAVALLLAWPAGAFQVLVYTESLFLFLSILAPLLNLKGRYWCAAMVGFLAGLMRPQGVLVSLLLLPLGMNRGAARGSLARSILLAGMPFLGLAAYMLFLQARVGSALAFLDVQASWSRHAHPLAIFESLWRVVTLQCLLTDGLSAVAGLMLIPVLLRRLPWPLGLFGAASVLMPLSTGTPLSMCRFLSVAFPFFLAAASLLRKRPLLLSTVILTGAMVQVWFLRRLANWEFAG